jgi:pimeloyl-ACP methyl ester carboxylesterase
VAKLRQRGATAIVIAGQSLGGNAALGYGARHPGLKGIIGLAPAHAPERITGRPEVAASLAKARAMIAAGKGGETDSFTDVNATLYQVRTTAAIYASFVGPDSAAVMPANAAKLTAPLLWVAGNADPSQLGPDYAFAKAPPNPLNRYVTVTASHLTTPDAAKEAVLAWLRELDR